jgi:hypothetical protein
MHGVPVNELNLFCLSSYDRSIELILECLHLKDLWLWVVEHVIMVG